MFGIVALYKSFVHTAIPITFYLIMRMCMLKTRFLKSAWKMYTTVYNETILYEKCIQQFTTKLFCIRKVYTSLQRNYSVLKMYTTKSIGIAFSHALWLCMYICACRCVWEYKRTTRTNEKRIRIWTFGISSQVTTVFKMLWI